MGITGCLRQSLSLSLSLSLLFFGIQSSATSRMKPKFTLQPTKFPGHIHFELQLPLAMVWVNEEAHKVLFVWERWEIEKNYFSNFSLTSKKEKKKPNYFIKENKRTENCFSISCTYVIWTCVWADYLKFLQTYWNN